MNKFTTTLLGLAALELEEAIANGGLEEKTTLFLFGTQFSF